MAEQLASAVGGWSLPKRGSWQMLNAYSEVPWLHGVVRRRAEAMAALEWVVYRAPKAKRAARLHGMRSGQVTRHRAQAAAQKAGELEPVYDHELLDLLEHPIAPELQLTSSAFWELLSTWMDLTGEGPIGVDGLRNEQGVRIGKPWELCPVLPSWITAVPSDGRPYFEVINLRHPRVDPRDLVWVRHLDPSNPYTGRGIGTGAVLADELDTDEYMSAAARSRFFNRGMPDFVLGIRPAEGKPRPTGEQLRQLTNDIENKHKGPDKAGGFHILGDDFKLQQVGHTLVESQYIDGRKFLRDMCMQVFGTPPEILGVLESSNKSTIAAAEVHFARYSTVPMAERFRAAFQATIVPEFGDDLILDYISPIPSDDEEERKMMIALPGAFTVNEVRARGGAEPRTDGNVLMKAPGAPSQPIAGDAPKPVVAGTEEKPVKTDDATDDEVDDAVPDT
jgi:phage portal protein BeeE